MTSRNSDVLYFPEQHNTAMAFCTFCDIQKKVTYHLKSQQYYTLESYPGTRASQVVSVKLSTQGKILQETEEVHGSADPAPEGDMNDSMKTRDAIDHGDSNSTAPGDAQRLNWLSRPQKKFASCQDPHWLVQVFFSPGRAGSAGISSRSAPERAEIRTRTGGLSGLENGSEDVPSLLCISPSRCSGLPYSGESSSMQPCSIFQFTCSSRSEAAETHFDKFPARKILVI